MNQINELISQYSLGVSLSNRQKRRLSKNSTTDGEILVELSKDIDWVVRNNVVNNPNTPVKTLVKLLENRLAGNEDEIEDNTVRYDIARNPNTPKELLTKLSKDKDWKVRCYVAYNPNTPIEMLDILSKDNKWGVRAQVAINSNTSKEILIKLSKDRVNSISSWATMRLGSRMYEE